MVGWVLFTIMQTLQQQSFILGKLYECFNIHGSVNVLITMDLTQGKLPIDICLSALHAFSLLMNQYGGKEVKFDFVTKDDIDKIL